MCILLGAIHDPQNQPLKQNCIRMLIMEHMKLECSDINFTDYKRRTGAQFRVYDLRSLNIFCE